MDNQKDNKSFMIKLYRFSPLTYLTSLSSQNHKPCCHPFASPTKIKATSMRIKLLNINVVAMLLAIVFMPSCKKEEAPTPPTGSGGGGGGAVLPSYLNPDLTYGSLADQDGNNYRTIQIGGQVWMAENLRSSTYSNGDPIPNVTDNTAWTQLTTGAWAHHNNDSQYENPYGKLYNWYAVADPRNVCPAGWHVPTDAEWANLTDYLEGNFVAGGKMKSTGTQYWDANNYGATNTSGFSGLPGGYRLSTNGQFSAQLGNLGVWWSASESDEEAAWFRALGFNDEGVERLTGYKRSACSVRCLKDAAISLLMCNSATNNGTLAAGIAASGISSSVPYTDGDGSAHNGQTVTSTGVTGLTATLAAGSFANGNGSLTYTITGTPSAAGTASFALNIGGQSCTLNRTVNDSFNSSPGAGVTFGGYSYATVVLGNGQEWMAENLRTTTYANGDPIPNITADSEWIGITTGAWVHYENNASYENPYGKLYNWYAVNDSRKVCPTGWHVPTDAEWQQLELALLMPYDQLVNTGWRGEAQYVGDKMKTTTLWVINSTDATNSSGFSGLPGGSRTILEGNFSGLGISGQWWSASESGAESAWSRGLLYSSAGIDRFGGAAKGNGKSVRCLRD
jgi:uncharacterized protein (TIGR02145 family)